MAAGHGHTEATRRLLQHLTITHCCVSSSTPLPLWVFPRQQQQPQGQGQEQETEARAAVVNAANAQTGETALWLAVHEVCRVMGVCKAGGCESSIHSSTTPINETGQTTDRMRLPLYV